VTIAGWVQYVFALVVLGAIAIVGCALGLRVGSLVRPYSARGWWPTTVVCAGAILVLTACISTWWSVRQTSYSATSVLVLLAAMIGAVASVACAAAAIFNRKR